MEGLAAKENEIYANIENNTQAQEYQNTLLSESLVTVNAHLEYRGLISRRLYIGPGPICEKKHFLLRLEPRANK